MAREAEFAFSVETRTQRCFHVLSLACQNQPKSGRDILFTPHAACYLPPGGSELGSASPTNSEPADVPERVSRWPTNSSTKF